MLYVAYGSNMNLAQMKFRCPKSKVVGNGIIKNWRLIFNIHADIIKERGQEVPVVIWDIHDDDWKMLDRYEGYPSYYVREEVNVIADDGQIKKAIVYVMAESRKGIYRPMANYLNLCLQGYIDNHIDTKSIYRALQYTLKNETSLNQYSKI